MLAFLILFGGGLLLLSGAYVFLLGPTSNNDDIKEVVIESGSSSLEIAKVLKDNNLIRNEKVFVLYLKLNDINNLKASSYGLSEDMGVKKIVSILEQGNNYNPDVIKVTIPEGKHISEIAEIYEKATNNSKDYLLKKWNDKEFVNSLIDEYWFITEDVLNKDIRYSLEGYFFADTYEFINKDVTAEEIAMKMLDQMNKVLNKYKADIEKSKYTVHEILTLSSIIEYEAILDEDRPKIAGVFYNRLDADWLLQSCATVGYAIDEWKLSYDNSELKTDSKYNTYYYKGLPVGPGNSPSEKSIEATIKPEAHDYYYFLANVCDPSSNETYYSKTLAEHNKKKAKYLTCLN